MSNDLLNIETNQDGHNCINLQKLSTACGSEAKKFAVLLYNRWFSITVFPEGEAIPILEGENNGNVKSN